jgi:DNA-binding SARP family transcriptional activator/class 3 adenylate cyclase/tetratricopeptide (TPR) repeat protein
MDSVLELSMGDAPRLAPHVPEGSEDLSRLTAQVFLSYNRQDSTAVEEVARRLRQDGVEPWFDRWSAAPGEGWQVQIAEALGAIDACAVFVGPHGLGDWAREELAVAQHRASQDRGFRLFMVLLPGAADLNDPALAFLTQRTWVDLRDGIGTAAGHRDLLRAIGRPPREGLEFRLLGSLEVLRGDGQPAALGGAKQRALLAALLLRANEVVPTTSLIDELWGEHPPATAGRRVQELVSRMRAALGSAGHRLTTRPPGYMLEIGAEELDADRCQRLYVQGRRALSAGEAQRGESLLREAERLWRGPPLAEFAYEPFAQAAIARLNELRLNCREERIEAQIALARHADALPELEALVYEQPLRERPRRQLMLALYRSGRQAEALAAYRDARCTLLDDLGVEPSDDLRALRDAIHGHDQSLPTRPPPADVTPIPPPLPEHVTTSTRKTVTVVVAVFAGRAARNAIDPEVDHGVTQVARHEAAAIIARHGGTFQSAHGGEIVGLFGYPQAQEDEGLRALRAADELRSSVARLPKGRTGELIVSIGLDSGEVLVDASPDVPAVFGKPFAESTALARAAQPGEVLLSEATRQLAPVAVVVEPARDVGAWRLRELVAGAPPVPRQLGTRMVGRAAELTVGHTAFAHAAATKHMQMLTVVGDAGMGKSRLAQELTDQLGDRATVLTGRCLSYGAGVALWPLREAVAQLGGESRDSIRALLDDAEDAGLVTDILTAALGLGMPENTSEQVPWAVRRLLEGLAQRRPLVLVIEDAQWAEPHLLDLLDYLVDWLTAPVLVLCLARPELIERRPQLVGGRLNVTSVVLGRLSDEQASHLLDELGESGIDGGERARILEKADGNPLFVEQLLAHRTQDPLWESDPEIPATIQRLLASRLDRLGPGERAVVERAAVIGREFWPSAVVELLPAEAEPTAPQHLLALVSRGLIRPERSTLGGEAMLRFHHILIRDVAYRSTPKVLRGELHERFARWLARRGNEYDEFVGYHLEQAFGYLRELERLDDAAVEVATEGGARLAAAGRRALARGEAHAAASLLGRSSELLTAGRRRRPDVLLDLGRALIECGDFRTAGQVLADALEQAREAGADALTAHALIELSYQQVLVDPSVRVDDMRAVADQAILLFEGLHDEAGLSRAWIHVAEACWTRCECEQMESALNRARDHAERAGDRRARSHILGRLARAAVIGPCPVPEGIRRCRKILADGEGDVTVTAVSESMLAVLEAMQGNFAIAREYSSASKRRLDDVGLSVTKARMQMYCAFVELLAGRPKVAEIELTEAYHVLDQLGERHFSTTMAALLARALYAEGRYDVARHYSEIAEATASMDDVVSHVIWRGTRGKLLARAGAAEESEHLVHSAVLISESSDFLPLRADALVDRADTFVILRRPREAARSLDNAVSLYGLKGMRVSAHAAAEARRLLTDA